jgi:K+-sensing histidine kinase KdpD
MAMVIVLGGLMSPMRAHLSIATTALILVVPVVIAVAIDGVVSGLVATTAGFFVYDFVFIPPYYTLSMGAAQNWLALGVAFPPPSTDERMYSRPIYLQFVLPAPFSPPLNPGGHDT